MAIADLFEAQRNESEKSDEAVGFLLPSVGTRIKADLEPMLASGESIEGNK